MNDLDFFIDIAMACARQSCCLRRKYGAVVVDLNRHIISTGFNGSPVGKAHCIKCWRNELNIKQGERIELCTSVHAEQNALIQSGKQSKGCKIYLYGWEVAAKCQIIPKPCFLCTKLLINSGIDTVITTYGVFNVHDLYDDYLVNMQPKNRFFDP